MAVSTIPKIQAPFQDLSSGDLDDLKGVDKTGFYYIRTGVAHAPQDWIWCLVIGGIGTVQLCFSQNNIFERAYTGSPLAWTEWKYYTPTN